MDSLISCVEEAWPHMTPPQLGEQWGLMIRVPAAPRKPRGTAQLSQSR
jgi:hypothetical protein